MQKEEIETFYPKSREDWRQWLVENHRSKQNRIKEIAELASQKLKPKQF